MRKNLLHYFSCCFCVIVLLFAGIYAVAQNPDTDKKAFLPAATVNKKMWVSPATNADIFGSSKSFIKNIGQYGSNLSNHAFMGNILYGYEGLNMPVLFTAKGLIFLQRKIRKLSSKEMERLERKGMSEEEIKEKTVPVDKTITMEWLNANPNPEIITDDAATEYHTYGLLQGKAGAFKKIIYKDLYPGIDAVYFFVAGSKPGYEYNLLVKPGADISLVKMKYKGDVSKIRTDSTGNLIISSGIDDIIQSAPLCCYADDKNDSLKTSFKIINNEVGFKTNDNYNTGRAIIIDPFVTSTSALSGQFNGIAKDIDFDYQGNVYVSGGGDASVQKMAKYNGSGALQWTFSGNLAVPLWQFGSSEGGWVVEKTSGNIYIGQGLAGGGFKVIRLSSAGVYDNYITNANLSFGENWKMLWSCNNGTPQILVAGGGGSANNELAVITPPDPNPAASNISGLSGGHNDISDIIIDPVTNDMYTLFSISVLNPSGDSKLYKHVPPYAPANIAWTNFSGYFTVKEPFNRPYFGTIDNSSNCIALNADYLFYWDGKNLKAFDKSTGTVTGSQVTLPTTALMQGGIFADECNNVFVGYTNGTIKVYKFNGAVFDDAAAADINITGFGNSAVLDITYDHARNLVYACGSSFVAAIDVSQYCALPVYTVSVVSDIANLSATASLTPSPSAGSTVSFSLFNGTTLITTNTTGIFTGLTTGVTYTVKAIINEACSGTQAVKDFILAAAPPPTTKTGIYLPNAFTPNGDANNDILKAIVVGMKEFHYFSIYNRYGELVFTTTNPSFGWDGIFKGKLQNTGAFVWMVEAVDAAGNIIREKGTTILIR